MRRLMATLLAMVAISISTPTDAGAQARILVTDTWLEGGSGGYNLQVWQEGGSKEIVLGLYLRDYGWIGVQADEWVPALMGSIGWGAGNQWTGAPGAVWICHYDPTRGVAVGYDQSSFYAFVETVGGTAINYIGSDHHGGYVGRSNVVSGWTNQYCVQLTLY